MILDPARQYLEGLLRIPFGQYTKEEIMDYIPNIIKMYNKIVEMIPENLDNNFSSITTYIEIQNNFKDIINLKDKLEDHYFNLIEGKFTDCKKTKIIKNATLINNFLKKNSLQNKKITHSGKNISIIKRMLKELSKTLQNDKKLWDMFMTTSQCELYKEYTFIRIQLFSIQDNIKDVQKYMKYIDATLDNSVYGHDKAKQQIKRIVGQWITGENSGYCFCFEGPPGVMEHL